MGKILINGLYFDNITNRGMTVNLFDNQSSDHSFGELIFTGNSDSLGKVSGEIDNKFIGKEIVVGIIEPGFIPQQTKLEVTNLGVFYTVKLDFDRNYLGHNSIISNISKWNSLVNHNKAQTELQEEIRKFKFQNLGIKHAHYSLVILSIILGLITTFPYNLILATLFFIIGETLGPFVIGLRPFWRRK